MDNVKKYLRERRDDLDVEPLPGDHVWQHIEKNTRTKKAPVVRLAVKWMAAAAVVLIFSTVAYIYIQQKPSSESTVAAIPGKPVKEAPPVVAAVPSAQVEEQPATDKTEHKTQEQHAVKAITAKKSRKPLPVVASTPKSPAEAMEENYAVIINYQLKRVNSMPIYAENAGYFHSFKKQWQQFQKDEQNIMQDIQTIGLNDNLVDHLITLYQQKLQLLKQLQAEISKMNNKARKAPLSEKREPSFMNL